MCALCCARSAGRWLAGLLAAEWIGVRHCECTVFEPRACRSDGGSWRRLGLIPETGLMLFVMLAAGWLAARTQHVRISASSSGWKRRVGGLLRHRAVLRMGSAAAGAGVSSWRRRAHHCSSAGHVGTRRLFRCLAGCGAVSSRLALARLEKQRIWRIAAIGGCWIGGHRDRLERHAGGDAGRCRRRCRAVARAARANPHARRCDRFGLRHSLGCCSSSRPRV